MVVQHNLTAMNSNRMLGITSNAQAKSTEKLSSGYKINRAADDAAGLSISEKMRKQIRGLTQASSNAQDGISAVQTAEGALNEVQDMLQRMNELAVKSANGTNSVEDRDYIQAEVNQLVTEVERVSTTTKFNETYLLKGTDSDGKVGGLTYSTATNLAKGASGSKTSINDDGTGTISTMYEGSSPDYSTGITFTGGRFNSHFYTFTVNHGTGLTDHTSYMYIFELDGAPSGTDIATVTEKSNETIGKTLYFSNTDEMAAQILKEHGDIYKSMSYNSDNNQMEFTLWSDVNSATDVSLHVGADSSTDNKIDLSINGMNARYLGINGLRVDGDTADNATNAIDTITSALQKVSSERSKMGAVQNRLEHTIKNLDNVVENTTSAESSIRDTDMATEMVSYSNNNILAQAGQAMLAQANQSNRGVLSLLR